MFALMLAVASIGRSHEVLLLKTHVQNADGDCETAYFSEKNYNDLYSAHRQSDWSVSSLNSLPVPESKIQATHFQGLLVSIEQWLQASMMCELALARNVLPNLCVAVIIFPFHYFW